MFYALNIDRLIILDKLIFMLCYLITNRVMFEFVNFNIIIIYIIFELAN